jgi:ubiquinone/menaquinone biosynthesis C-methylase UbiE
MPRDHFDILAPFYEHFIGQNTPTAWAGRISPAPGWKILDAGGGTGRMSAQLMGEGITICVTDVSRGMLEQARLKPGLIPVLGCSETLPYPDQCFDFVMMTDAYHHVADQGLTVQELYRVLKPDGIILLEEPNIHFLGVKITAILEKVLLMRSHIESPQKIVKRFQTLGGKVALELEGYQAYIWVSKPAGQPI